MCRFTGQICQSYGTKSSFVLCLSYMLYVSSSQAKRTHTSEVIVICLVVRRCPAICNDDSNGNICGAVVGCEGSMCLTLHGH